MSASMRDNDQLQMNAYCDGELDPVSAIEFERRLAGDEILKAQYNRLLSLRRTLRSLPQYDVPAGLQARTQSALDADRPARANRPGQVGYPVQVGRPRQRSWSFQALAAAAVFGAVISSSVMLTMERYDRHEDVAREVVAGHIRSLLAPQPFDVASSDRHTVKPWFTSRLPESPQVPDLAAQGFVLLGGPRGCHWPRSGCNYNLQTCQAHGQLDDPAAWSICLGSSGCGIQRPKLERVPVHLHCSFGLAQR